MEKEYNRMLGIEFLQTMDAPLNHVKIHPLLFAELLRELPGTDIIDILIHKTTLPEITLEEKVEQISKR